MVASWIEEHLAFHPYLLDPFGVVAMAYLEACCLLVGIVVLHYLVFVLDCMVFYHLVHLVFLHSYHPFVSQIG